MWVRSLELSNVRNVREVNLRLSPGLNVFLGSNAQGKTTLLEAVGLVSRGRSFRSDDTRSLISRGATRLLARATTEREAGRRTALEVELQAPRNRSFRVDGREVPPREYHGRLEVVLYSTDRLRILRGPMRERRQFLDRGAAALWPAYRRLVRDYERVVLQRNAALLTRSRELESWDERLAELGSELRRRRAEYVGRLRAGLARGFRPRGERYDIGLAPEPTSNGASGSREALLGELERQRAAEQKAGRCLVGPHRDQVAMTVNGEDAALGASSGQSRSLLLALALATLAVYREERGEPAVALLDDLDSELDEERACELCGEVAACGQALVTTAHPGWAAGLKGLGSLYRVEAGAVRAA